MARKILLADDSVTAQNMGRKILTDAGYEVITVNNGSAALKKIAESKPDLIVLDVYMPGYSGLEVCQRIKENRETARIPILLTVGKLEPFKPEEARRARADAFVVKPFEASELLAALTKLEDKIIPGAEPYKPGRFAKAIASVEHDGTGPNQFGDGDEGWKARLRIPAGTAKETEPPLEYAATQGKGFRDFIEPPSRKTPPKAATPAAFERPVPSGVPHDITPEEIAAIAAAAAQLKGAAPAKAEVVVPGAEPEPAAVPTHPDARATEISSDEAAPVTFASAPDVEAGSSNQNESTTAPQADRVAEIPGEPAQDISLPGDIAITEPVALDAAATVADQPSSENSATHAFAEVALESGLEVSAVEVESTQHEARSDEAVATLSVSAEHSAVEPGHRAGSETPATPVPEPSPATSAAAPPPADDEVMAALHALIPTDLHVAQSSAAINTDESNTAPGAMAASVGSAHSVSRWIAQEVSLSAEEAMLSLDREMEKAVGAGQAVGQTGSFAEAVTLDPSLTVPAESERTHAKHAQAYAIGTAAGAESPAPWPVGARADAPESKTTAASSASSSPKAESAALHNASAESIEASNETKPVGGPEDMAASWKNIRDSIAGSAAKPALAKEDFADATRTDNSISETQPFEAATKSDGTATKPAATDPTAIANIVESVLAELRPKIVEEIARKLSEPKK